MCQREATITVMVMKAADIIRCSSSVVLNRSLRRFSWISLTTSLLMSTGQVSSAENFSEYQTPTTLDSNVALVAVGDTELNAIYGKGENRQGLPANDGLSVILWDEGKRKGLAHERQMGVVTHGKLDVQRYAKPSAD